MCVCVSICVCVRIRRAAASDSVLPASSGALGGVNEGSMVVDGMVDDDLVGLDDDAGGGGCGRSNAASLLSALIDQEVRARRKIRD